MPRSPQTVLFALLLFSPLAGQEQRFDAATATVADWAERLRQRDPIAIDLLASARPPRLSLLDELLRHADETVVQSAAAAAARIGPPAAVVGPRLLELLQRSPSWWTQRAAATALGALAADSREVREALAGVVFRSDVPALRHACLDAWRQLDGRVCEGVFAAVDAGEVAPDERAVEILLWLGEAFVPVALDLVPKQTAAASAARAALVAYGWRAVDRLEARGHLSLAQQALRVGPLRGVDWGDELVLDEIADEPPTNVVPQLVVDESHGHGGGLSLFRAREDGGVLVVDRIRVRLLAPGTAPEVVVSTTTVPRERALAAARQLAVIARMSGTRPAAEQMVDADGTVHLRSSIKNSTDDQCLFVRVESEGREILAARFAGYPSSANATARLRPQAAVHVLAELTDGCVWTTRAPTAADREHAVARQRAWWGPLWLRPRLAAAIDGLGG